MASGCGTESQQEEVVSVENKYSQLFEPVPTEVEARENNPMTKERNQA